jgi:hypothetical protein
MVEVIHRQVNVDMYFVDWEKSRGMVRACRRTAPFLLHALPRATVLVCVCVCVRLGLQLVKTGGRAHITDAHEAPSSPS